ncbi:MAG TPA: nitroreductase family protein, partial [Bacteroidales bacterium]|nr:nitroreductase family protein [Bacteroidales bacterium]
MDRTWKEITDIALPAPRRKGGMPLMEALNRRESSRELTSKPLDLQTLSDLLWAAWGYNRDHKRTAPSSHNRQEIDLYVFLESGTYIYDAAGNRLLLHDKDD